MGLEALAVFAECGDRQADAVRRQFARLVDASTEGGDLGVAFVLGDDPVADIGDPSSTGGQ